MPVFPSLLIYDKKLRTDDRTRLDATRCYVTDDEGSITKVEVDPGDGTGYVDVTGSNSNDWFLDYQYATTGTQTVNVRVTTASTSGASGFDIDVVGSSDDKIFSSDQDLMEEEPNIFQYLPKWRNSFIYLHRRASEKIFAWLDRNGFVDVYADKFTSADLTDDDELTEWSKFEVLEMLFNEVSNSPDDYYARRARQFASDKLAARSRFVLRIDIDGDGTVDTFEDIGLKGARIFRT